MAEPTFPSSHNTSGRRPKKSTVLAKVKIERSSFLNCQEPVSGDLPPRIRYADACIRKPEAANEPITSRDAMEPTTKNSPLKSFRTRGLFLA